MVVVPAKVVVRLIVTMSSVGGAGMVLFMGVDSLGEGRVGLRMGSPFLRGLVSGAGAVVGFMEGVLLRRVQRASTSIVVASVLFGACFLWSLFGR